MNEDIKKTYLYVRPDICNQERVKFTIPQYKPGSTNRYFSLGCDGCKGIVVALMETPLKIKNLSFRITKSNYFFEEAAKILFKGISALQNLESLNFQLDDANMIYAKGAKHIFEAISNLKKLGQLSLTLEGQIVQDEGIQAIGEMLPSCTHLRKINFSFLYEIISITGAKSLAKGISSLENLTDLSLVFGDKHDFGDEGVIVFCQEISKCKQVSCLKLDFQNKGKKSEDISEQLISQLSILIQSLPKLYQFQIISNDYENINTKKSSVPKMIENSKTINTTSNHPQFKKIPRVVNCVPKYQIGNRIYFPY